MSWSCMQTPSDLNDMISLCLMNEALKMIIFCKYLLLAQKCHYITCTHKKTTKYTLRFKIWEYWSGWCTVKNLHYLNNLQIIFYIIIILMKKECPHGSTVWIEGQEKKRPFKLIKQHTHRNYLSQRRIKRDILPHT